MSPASRALSAARQPAHGRRVVGQTIGHHRGGRLLVSVLRWEKGNRQALPGGLGAQRGPVQVPALGHPPPVHGQQGKQGQFAHIDLQVGRALDVQQGGHTLVSPLRGSRAQGREERGHQQRRRHGRKPYTRTSNMERRARPGCTMVSAPVAVNSACRSPSTARAPMRTRPSSISTSGPKRP